MNDYNDAVACKADYPMPVQNTISARLERDQKELTQRLKLVTEALEALNKNAELKELLEKISAITHF